VLALCALSLAMTPVRAAHELLQLFVTQPYLELHTGPGRGYPVTQVVARGESVDVLFRRTDWFKVRTERGVEGWASAGQLMLATLADGTPFKVNMGDRAGFASHRWESAAYGALSITDNLKVELGASQYTGNVSDGELVEIGLAHVFMPEWRFSPLVDLGTGYRWVQPKATLAKPVDRSDEVGYYGVGARFYLTRRFFLRGDFRKYVVFTRTNENEVNEEWRLGFGFFY
jgi:hypothetical protein